MMDETAMFEQWIADATDLEFHDWLDAKLQEEQRIIASQLEITAHREAIELEQRRVNADRREKALHFLQGLPPWCFDQKTGRWLWQTQWLTLEEFEHTGGWQ